MNEKVLQELHSIIPRGKFETDEEYKHKVDRSNWDIISESKNLSEDFIKEFKYKVRWYHIYWCQKLSEDFIREFKDINKAHWDDICKRQKLSEAL